MHAKKLGLIIIGDRTTEMNPLWKGSSESCYSCMEVALPPVEVEKG